VAATSGGGGDNDLQQQQQQQNAATRLFEIGPNGQLSLKAGIRHLNVSHCQLVVQASDSLGPSSAHHKQVARVNIYVAPQIVGRSLNLSAGQAEAGHENGGHENEAKLFTNSQHYSLQSAESVAANWPAARKNSRDFAQRLLKEHANQNGRQAPLVEQKLAGAESVTVASQPEVYVGQPAPSSQRSSLATVMASLQHMVKSVNFFEMPMSSALLLSVLLTFLVCLLLIVVISMTVHVYRRSIKARSRRQQRQRLQAAARLRHHAQLVAGGAGGGSSTVSNASPYGSATSSISSPQLSTHAPPPGQPRSGPTNASRNYYDNLALAASSTSTITTTTATAAQANANKPPDPTGAGPESSNHNNNSNSNNCSSLTSSTGMTNSAEASRVSSASSPSLCLLALGGGGGGKQRAPPNGERRTKRRPKTADKHFQALKISISNETTTSATRPATDGSAETYSRPMGPSKQNPIYVGDTSGAPVTMQASGDSKQDKRSQFGEPRAIASRSSGLTSDDDSSSATNCGHYSVNGTMENAGGRRRAGPPTLAKGREKRDALDTAIGKLVRQHGLEADQEGLAAQDTNGGQKPAADSYRRLPLMNSLVRPAKSQQQQQQARPPNFVAANRVAPIDQLLSSHQQRVEQAAQVAAAAVAQHRVGLMAMVRESMNGDQARQQAAAQIRWPSESIPQRIKKLTWDDELSCCDDSIGTEPGQRQQARLMAGGLNGGGGDNDDDDDEECYVSPDVRLGSERELHRYEAEQELETQQQNKFLFSLSNHMLPSLSQQQQHQQPAGDSRAPDDAGEPLSKCLDLDELGGEATSAPSSHVNGRHNQNNCLDYTIVNDSQFHADSLAGAISSARGEPPVGRRQGAADRASALLLAANGAGDDNDDHERSMTSSSQTNVTFKLNQNYQDLRLMTTAIL
jgi:hypothetical protein